jgi:ferredoxin
MTIRKVWIEEGCIAAGYCNETCPAVFGLSDFGEAFVEDDAVFEYNEDGIREAARNCPVKVIKFEET